MILKPDIVVVTAECSSSSITNEAMLGGRQPVVKLEPLKTDPLTPVAFNINMNAKQIIDACK